MGDLLGSPCVAFLFWQTFFSASHHEISRSGYPNGDKFKKERKMVISSKKNEKCILSRFGYTRGPWRGTSYAGPTGLGRRVEVRV